MDRTIVLKVVAIKLGPSPPDGEPCIMANGEPGVFRYAKRPRVDRRRPRRDEVYILSAGRIMRPDGLSAGRGW
jgi:hypothetical protein